MPGKDLAFITGASGFVGSAVVRALIRSGYAVRALVRGSSPRVNLDGVDLEIIEGDMLDAETVTAAVKGARYVFHIAADYRLWASDADEITRANVDGTRAVMAAAQASGVERIVYTSSVATLKLRGRGTPADETSSLSEDEAIGTYKRSKIVAERLVEDMVRIQGLPAVIVNPSTPIGPRDVRPTPTGRLIIEAASGRMPAFVDTGLNVVHVDDVAEGHVAALQRGRIGERYILGGENVTLAELLARIALLTQRRPPRIGCRAQSFILWHSPQKRRRTSRGASRLSHSMVSGWPSTRCFSPLPRRSASSDTQRVLLGTLFTMRFSGSARWATCDDA